MEVRYQLRYSPAAPAYRPEQLRDPSRCTEPMRTDPNRLTARREAGQPARPLVTDAGRSIVGQSRQSRSRA